MANNKAIYKNEVLLLHNFHERHVVFLHKAEMEELSASVIYIQCFNKWEKDLAMSNKVKDVKY